MKDTIMCLSITSNLRKMKAFKIQLEAGIIATEIIKRLDVMFSL